MIPDIKYITDDEGNIIKEFNYAYCSREVNNGVFPSDLDEADPKYQKKYKYNETMKKNEFVEVWWGWHPNWAYGIDTNKINMKWNESMLTPTT